MIRVWALFFVLAFSVAFLIHRPDGVVIIPYGDEVLKPTGDEVLKIPADVFWYHTNEHLIMIILSLVLLSFFRWPVDHELYPAFVLFVVIQIVDMILFRLFYRNWPIEAVPWNFIKVGCFGVVTCYLQIRTIWKNIAK